MLVDCVLNGISDKLAITLVLSLFRSWFEWWCCCSFEDSFVFKFNWRLSIPRQLKSVSSLKSSFSKVFANKFWSSISCKNASSSFDYFNRLKMLVKIRKKANLLLCSFQ